VSVGAGGADPISLSEKLLHNVYIGDEDDGPGVESLTPDWELTTYAGTRRYLSVTLLKATPMPGVTVWWSRVFESGKEDIDVVRAGGGGGGAKMKEVWDEAHRMFKEKVGKREKEEVFYDDDEPKK